MYFDQNGPFFKLVTLRVRAQPAPGRSCILSSGLVTTKNRCPSPEAGTTPPAQGGGRPERGSRPGPGLGRWPRRAPGEAAGPLGAGHPGPGTGRQARWPRPRCPAQGGRWMPAGPPAQGHTPRAGRRPQGPGPGPGRPSDAWPQNGRLAALAAAAAAVYPPRGRPARPGSARRRGRWKFLWIKPGPRRAGLFALAACGLPARPAASPAPGHAAGASALPGSEEAAGGGPAAREGCSPGPFPRDPRPGEQRVHRAAWGSGPLETSSPRAAPRKPLSERAEAPGQSEGEARAQAGPGPFEGHRRVGRLQEGCLGDKGATCVAVWGAVFWTEGQCEAGPRLCLAGVPSGGRWSGQSHGRGAAGCGSRGGDMQNALHYLFPSVKGRRGVGVSGCRPGAGQERTRQWVCGAEQCPAERPVQRPRSPGGHGHPP